MIKKWIRGRLPDRLNDRYRDMKNRMEKIRNRNKTIEEIFTDIYLKRKWGGSREDFCSGEGSTDTNVVTAYIKVISQRAETEGFKGLTFVDLGCGDFRIGRKLLPLCSQYIGVDIVKPLILKNRAAFQNDRIQFLHLDVVKDKLPKGDVYFIRQVFQHLCNQHIVDILSKIKKYKWVFITEHYPNNNHHIVYNADKYPGSDVRVYKNSGVYLSKPPFNLPSDKLEMVLEVPGVGLGHGKDQGVIRTFLYKAY